MEPQARHIHEEIIARCLKGDRDAHFELYQLYSRSMYNVGYRIVNDEDEAKDVLQESFISAFRNLSRYRGDASFGSWLKRIVVNKAINTIKRRKAERLEDEERIEIEEQEDVFEDYDFQLEQVMKAISRLPDGYRTVLSLYLLEGYDHAEIAQVLGISESTSKSQFNRSKKKLKEILEGGIL
ncbi:MAG: sigma-70 family RNA polymerase sigma factor [Cyclobacteriaceae bacterium]